MKGKCLCGEVEFELSGDIPNIYQCHCSLCRKVSGSASNSAMLVGSKNFRWLRGIDSISRFVEKSGFISDFCSNCGSPLPSPLKSGHGYWVPAGLLEDCGELRIVAHVYVDSRAPWDSIVNEAKRFAETAGDDLPRFVTEDLPEVIDAWESVGVSATDYPRNVNVSKKDKE